MPRWKAEPPSSITGHRFHRRRRATVARRAADPESGWWPRLVFHGGAAGFAQRVQQGVQLGTHGVAESALQMPHAVAALLEFQVAAVLLPLVVHGVRGRPGSAAFTTLRA